MTDPQDTTAERVTLLRGEPPSWLERSVVVLAGGDTLAGDVLERSRAIAVLEHGSIVLERGEERLTLDEGAVFCTAGMRRVLIRNEGTGPSVIACARRKPPDSRY